MVAKLDLSTFFLRVNSAKKKISKDAFNVVNLFGSREEVDGTIYNYTYFLSQFFKSIILIYFRSVYRHDLQVYECRHPWLPRPALRQPRRHGGLLQQGEAPHVSGYQ